MMIGSELNIETEYRYQDKSQRQVIEEVFEKFPHTILRTHRLMFRKIFDKRENIVRNSRCLRILAFMANSQLRTMQSGYSAWANHEGWRHREIEYVKVTK